MNDTQKSWSRVRRLLGAQEVLLLAVLIAMVTVFTVLNPRFFTLASMGNILQDWGPVMLIALGQTYVIITGGIDLSVGSTIGLSGVVGALAIRELTAADMPAAVAILSGILIAALVGIAVGAINGLLITKARLAPFIATLAMMGTGAGLTLVITKGLQIGGGPSEVVAIGSTLYLGVFTLPLLVVCVITAVAWLYLHRSRFGRWTYAVGSSPFASRAVGINVESHLMKVYMLSGLLAGLAGALLYFRLGAGSPTAGLGRELSSIAAVVIGGASLFGGRGRMGGTVIGALINTSVLSGLILIGVEPNWQQVVIGVLIAVSVIAQGAGKKGAVR